MSPGEQLAAEIEKSRETDFDIENAENYAGSDSEGSGVEEEDSDDGRSHYAEVGKSVLRDTAAEKPLKAAYKGQKSSRQSIFGHSSAESDISENDCDDGVSDVEEASEDGSEVTVDNDGYAGSVTGSGTDQSGISDSDNSDSDDASDQDEPNSEDERQAADLRNLLAQDEKTMVQEVAKAATEEGQKGRAVRKQLGIYDSLLDSRIKLQKGLISINILIDERSKELSIEKTSAAEHAALDLIGAIFSLRDAFAKQEDSLSKSSRKRKYDEIVPSADLWRDLQQIDGETSEWRDKTLIKWSQKTQSVSAIDKSKKFKALNQGILAQIEELKSDREKLLKRTQVKRFKAINKSMAMETSVNVFDDGDFYQEMLKDFIDSRMLDSGAGKQIKWVATKQTKQKKANVDTRASKGRKLRFHVHEKLQNFMAPMPTGTWHEEQVDELFGSLFGQSMRVDEEIDEDGDRETNAEARRVEVDDDFRLFG